jgi:hypothetical protein
VFLYFFTFGDKIVNMDHDDFYLNDEENEEFEKERREERKKLKNHPLLKQAQEILSIVDALLDTYKDEEILKMYGGTLRESAMIIIAKLNSALVSDNYLVCMQNAALIRDHGEYLRLLNHMFNSSDVFDKKYVEMFRQEMENFRNLFKDWAKEIRKMENDFEDEWGLFGVDK